MILAPPRPSSGAYNCINSLWFYRWSVVVSALLVHDQQRSKVKSEAVNTVFAPDDGRGGARNMLNDT